LLFSVIAIGFFLLLGFCYCFGFFDLANLDQKSSALVHV